MNTEENYWGKLIKKQSSSGITKARFCREHQISLSKFKYWHRKQRENNEIANDKFIQVYPKNFEEISSELVFPNGIILKINSQTDLGLVKKLQELFI
jgi:hypothetical protein